MIVVYTIYDFIYFPAYVLLLLLVIFFYKRTCGLELDVRKHVGSGFLYRVFFCILFFLMQQFYFGVGDSFTYYLAIQDLHNISWDVKQGFVTSFNGITAYGTGLFYSFSEYSAYLTNNPSNAAVVKIGYWLSFLCGNSYITLCLFFSSFAFVGCWKAYLLFIRYYPKLRREFAICILYLPSVCFWSSGLLKDSITLGSMGMVVSGLHTLLVDKKKIFPSIVQVLLFGYILLLIKPYILLALTPGLLIWLFMKFNFKGLNRNFRSLITFLFILTAVAVGALLLQYFSSTEYAKNLSTENLTERINEMRDVYAVNEETKGGSYFTTGSDNPVLSFPLGIIATLFRPFPWEARNLNMLFTAFEAFIFMLVTLYVFIKLGVINTFRVIFRNGETIFFFIYVIIFAGAVGSSTANFGTLARYKIPCLPYYFMMLFVVMHVTGLAYPKWLNKLIGIKKPRPVIQPVKKLQQT